MVVEKLKAMIRIKANVLILNKPYFVLKVISNFFYCSCFDIFTVAQINSELVCEMLEFTYVYYGRKKMH